MLLICDMHENNSSTFILVPGHLGPTAWLAWGARSCRSPTPPLTANLLLNTWPPSQASQQNCPRLPAGLCAWWSGDGGGHTVPRPPPALQQPGRPAKGAAGGEGWTAGNRRGWGWEGPTAGATNIHLAHPACMLCLHKEKEGDAVAHTHTDRETLTRR